MFLLPELHLLWSSWEGRVDKRQRGRNYADDTAWVPGGAFQALKTAVAQVRCALGSGHHLGTMLTHRASPQITGCASNTLNGYLIGSNPGAQHPWHSDGFTGQPAG